MIHTNVVSGKGKHFLSCNTATGQLQSIKVDGQIEKPIADAFRQNNANADQGVYSIKDPRLQELGQAQEASGGKPQAGVLGEGWELMSSGQDGSHTYRNVKNGDAKGQGQNTVVVNSNSRSVMLNMQNGPRSGEYEAQEVMVQFDKDWNEPKADKVTEMVTTEYQTGEWTDLKESGEISGNELGWVIAK